MIAKRNNAVGDIFVKNSVCSVVNKTAVKFQFSYNQARIMYIKFKINTYRNSGKLLNLGEFFSSTKFLPNHSVNL